MSEELKRLVEEFKHKSLHDSDRKYILIDILVEIGAINNTSQSKHEMDIRLRYQ